MGVRKVELKFQLNEPKFQSLKMVIDERDRQVRTGRTPERDALYIGP